MNECNTAAAATLEIFASLAIWSINSALVISSSSLIGSGLKPSEFGLHF
jgi:hypothetical protein